MSRAQPTGDAPRVAEIMVSSAVRAGEADAIQEFVPGLEDLAKDAAALPRGKVATAEPKIVLEPKPVPVETSKLQKEAKLGGALDLVAAYDKVAPLYSTKPYVSILPPEMLSFADEGIPDRESFVPTTVFEKDESYGRFERQGRDHVGAPNSVNDGNMFGSHSIPIIIPR